MKTYHLLPLVCAACAAPPSHDVDFSPVARGHAGLDVQTAVIWPESRIRVCFVPDPPGVDSQRLAAYVQRGARVWEEVSNVRFTDFTACNGDYSGIAVQFVEDALSTPWSYYGTESIGWGPSLALTAKRITPDQVALDATHAFGHALGFAHADAADPAASKPPSWATSGRLTPSDAATVAQVYGAADEASLDPLPMAPPPVAVTLVNQATGACLDNPGANAIAHDIVDTFGCNQTPAQVYDLLAVNGGSVQLRNRASQLCVSVQGEGPEGTPLIQMPCTNEAAQTFAFIEHKSGDYAVKSGLTSRCVADDNGGRDAGPLIEQTCNKAGTQRWKVVKRSQ